MRRSKIPSYRHREIRGWVYGMVRLTDSVTGRQQDIYLGDYGSKESHDQYAKELSAWEERGRRLDDPKPKSTAAPTADYAGELPEGITIVELVEKYDAHAKVYYSQSEYILIGRAWDALIEEFGRTAAANFGPKKLREVREGMLKRDWARKTINGHVNRIVRIFKWGSSEELIAASVYAQLATVEPLKKGRTTAREPVVVPAVQETLVDALEPYLSRQVWAMIQLQRMTGARGGELFTLCIRDINREDASVPWIYSPVFHKTAHRGKPRTIYFGPKAQEILRPFMFRPDDVCLFSPSEAEKERRAASHAARKTPEGQGNEPGTNVREEPQHHPGDRYTKNSYRTAIQRACKRVFPPPEPLGKMMVKRANGKMRMESAREVEARLTRTQKSERLEWEKAHRWHPHQLRHRAATNIRKEYGLEAAQIILGHSSAQVTDAVYAERDTLKAQAIIQKIG